MAQSLRYDQYFDWPLQVRVLARQLEKPDARNHIFEWILSIKPMYDVDALEVIESVEFVLHPTYPNRKRLVPAPPFSLRETGYGEFNAVIRVRLALHTHKSVYVFKQRIVLLGAPVLATDQIADESKWMETKRVVQIDFRNPSRNMLALMTELTLFKAGHFELFEVQGKLGEAHKGINEMPGDKNQMRYARCQPKKRPHDADTEDIIQIKDNPEVLIQLPIEVGVRARRLRFATQKRHIYEWIFYVKPFYDEDYSAIIREVNVELHSSFPQPHRSLIAPPYKVMETAYAAEFDIKVLIRLQDRSQKQSQFVYKVYMGDAPIVLEENAGDEWRWLHRKRVVQIFVKNPAFKLREILSKVTRFKPGHFDMFLANGKLEDVVQGDMNEYKGELKNAAQSIGYMDWFEGHATVSQKTHTPVRRTSPPQYPIQVPNISTNSDLNALPESKEQTDLEVQQPEYPAKKPSSPTTTDNNLNATLQSTNQSDCQLQLPKYPAPELNTPIMTQNHALTASNVLPDLEVQVPDYSAQETNSPTTTDNNLNAMPQSTNQSNFELQLPNDPAQEQNTAIMTPNHLNALTASNVLPDLEVQVPDYSAQETNSPTTTDNNLNAMFQSTNQSDCELQLAAQELNTQNHLNALTTPNVLPDLEVQVPNYSAQETNSPTTTNNHLNNMLQSTNQSNFELQLAKYPAQQLNTTIMTQNHFNAFPKSYVLTALEVQVPSYSAQETNNPTTTNNHLNYMLQSTNQFDFEHQLPKNPTQVLNTPIITQNPLNALTVPNVLPDLEVQVPNYSAQETNSPTTTNNHLNYMLQSTNQFDFVLQLPNYPAQELNTQNMTQNHLNALTAPNVLPDLEVPVPNYPAQETNSPTTTNNHLNYMLQSTNQFDFVLQLPNYTAQELNTPTMSQNHLDVLPETNVLPDLEVHLPMLVGSYVRQIESTDIKPQYEWHVYLKKIYDEDLSVFIEKVTFELEDFKQEFIAPRYLLGGTAEHDFNIKVKIYVKGQEQPIETVHHVYVDGAPMVSDEGMQDESNVFQNREIVQLILKNPTAELREILPHYTAFKPGHFDLYQKNAKCLTAVKGINEYKDKEQDEQETDVES